MPTRPHLANVCSRYFAALAHEHNLNLHITPAMASEESAFPNRCEGTVAWNGSHLVDNSSRHTHVNVIYNLEYLLAAMRAPAFSATYHTADNSMCSPRDLPLVEHSRSPAIRSTLLLPIANEQRSVITSFADSPNVPERRWRTGLSWLLARIFQSNPPPRRCAWFGKQTGYAKVQHKYNLNRTRCNASQTDRQCVVALLDRPYVRFGTDGSAKDYDCMLSIDGNTYASNFKTSLQGGQLVVRVGGYNSTTRRRLSSYEWFEPFLRAGEHYVQTTIDALPETLRRVEAMGVAEMQRIARNGQRAFFALVNSTTIRCYVEQEIRRAAVGAGRLKLKPRSDVVVR